MENQSIVLTDKPVATTASLITGVGRSAVAVVAVRGPDARHAMLAFFRPASDIDFRVGQVRYGHWQSTDEGESVVVTPIADDHFEIHCHGGSAATSQVLDQLASRGVAIVDADRWRRERGTPRLIAEAESVMSRCVTERTAGIAMAQVRGALHAWCTAGIESLSPETLGSIRSDAAAMQRHAAVTTRLDRPFRVVLVGPPNVGKSSLVNAIVGYDRSITMDMPGTTRDVLHADTVIAGLPVRVSDTAGLRDSDDAIEREGVARARAAAEQADLIVSVRVSDLVDSEMFNNEMFNNEATSSEATSIESTSRKDAISFRGPTVIHVLNKVDLSPMASKPERVIETVAVTGQGVDSLIARIGEVLGEQLPDSGVPVPLIDRQADCIATIATCETVDQARGALAALLD